MLSSANIDIEGALILLALLIFFCSGFIALIIVFIINKVQKKTKSGLYYFLSFVLSGIAVLTLATIIFFAIFFSNM
ncbi:hypothetical protein SAMN05660477_00263 [Soonwooa buanensis]|uniref:Uncharacterized protein n=1 Tax=Soonwooa buanensis TaxID=619805 RepID=A0A1T5CR52_9FLAO|nr:hypothetical protein [Soonwooa buanensis]SKB61965.1 hypothetical protein SAMN05660477_00263 [Soonwooa buanensis]